MRRLLPLLALFAGCARTDEVELPPAVAAAFAEAGPDSRLALLLDRPAAERARRLDGLPIRRVFRHVPLAVMDLTEGEARDLVGRRGARLFVDAPLAAAGGLVYEADADLVRRAVGADEVHAGTPLPSRDGTGVGVAILDSGVWTAHPALQHVPVVAHADFVGDPGGPSPELEDRYGHGTMVAGVLAGSGASYAGIAPGVELVVARVLDDAGAGTTSSVVAAIDWIVDEAPETGVDIVHLSVGASPQGSFASDPLAIAADTALDAGLIVVAAAGNLGTSDGAEVFGGIVSPATHPGVIAVGATDPLGTAIRSDDLVSAFSSRGPTPFDGIGKPDLVAPGADLVLPLRPGSTLWSTATGAHLDEWVGVDLGRGAYAVASGTSFAAPSVTGSIALLREAEPSLTAIGARAALQITAQSMADPTLLAAGAGQLNAVGAVRLVDYWSALARGDTPSRPVPEDVLSGEVVPWSLQVLWDGWLTTPDDVSWLNDGGVLGVGELDDLGILWEGVPVRYSGVRLSGHEIMDGSFAFADGVWGTGILWDGLSVQRSSSRVWTSSDSWEGALVWPGNVSSLGATSPLFEPAAFTGLTSPVAGTTDPQPPVPDFDSVQ